MADEEKQNYEVELLEQEACPMPLSVPGIPAYESTRGEDGQCHYTPVTTEEPLQEPSTIDALIPALDKVSIPSPFQTPPDRFSLGEAIESELPRGRFTTSPDGDFVARLSGNTTIEVSREFAFRGLANLSGQQGACTAADIGGGSVNELLESTMQVVGEVAGKSPHCVALSKEERADVTALSGVGVDLLTPRNDFADSLGVDLRNVDDVMDVSTCTEGFGLKACAGASTEGGGVKLTIPFGR